MAYLVYGNYESRPAAKHMQPTCVCLAWEADKAFFGCVLATAQMKRDQWTAWWLCGSFLEETTSGLILQLYVILVTNSWGSTVIINSIVKSLASRHVYATLIRSEHRVPGLMVCSFFRAPARHSCRQWRTFLDIALPCQLYLYSHMRM